MQFLEWTLWGNPVHLWLVAVCVAAGTVLVLRLARSIVYTRLDRLARRTRNQIDDLVADMVGRTGLFFFFMLSIWAGAKLLELPERADVYLNRAVFLALLIQVAVWAMGLFGYLIEHYVRLEMKEGAPAVASTTALNFIARLVIWSVIVIVALDNLGWDVTALVAGLGVGGIAVALAAQNILGDLFASLSIMFDKPFVVGDFIVVGDLPGTVEQIGLKTTRVRSLHGEQLVFSNNDLLGSRIRNFKRMVERRIVFSFGVVYQTPYDKLSRIPEMVRGIIETAEQARFDRAHFKEYGDSALNFEVVYWVKTSDFNTYMDLQQKINLALFRRFEEEGIDFAYPSRTLYFAHPLPSATDPK